MAGFINRTIERYKNVPIAARAALWFMVCSTLQQAIALITVPIFTRVLDTEEYGLYSSYVAWENILLMLVSLRLDYTVFNKGMSKFKNERDGYVASMQITTTGIYFFLLGGYLIFQGYVNNITEMTTSLMLLMILQAGVNPAYSFYMLRERYEYKIRTYVIAVISISLANPLIGLLAINLIGGDKGICRILSYAGVYIAFGVVLYVINFKRGLRKSRFKYIKFAILFNLPMIPHYLSTYILNQSDRIMIQKMVGMKEVAIYSVTYSAAMIMQIVSQSLTNALTPWYYEKLEDNNIESVKKIYIPLLLCVIVPVFLFILLAPEVMFILAPNKYSEGIYVVPPVASSIVFLMMYSFFSIPEFFYNANKFSSVASTISAIINIGLNYVGIIMFGYIATGYTTMLCYMLLAVGHFLYAKKIVTQRGLPFFDDKQTYGIMALMVVITIVSSILYRFVVIRGCIIAVLIIGLIVKRRNIINLIKNIKS